MCFFGCASYAYTLPAVWKRRAHYCGNMDRSLPSLKRSQNVNFGDLGFEHSGYGFPYCVLQWKT
jgi:hypothetical protein